MKRDNIKGKEAAKGGLPTEVLKYIPRSRSLFNRGTYPGHAQSGAATVGVVHMNNPRPKSCIDAWVLPWCLRHQGGSPVLVPLSTAGRKRVYFVLLKGIILVRKR